jgi:hypothetical protein
MHHKIAFGRSHKQERLLVQGSQRKCVRGGHYESHFVADGYPVTILNAGRSIGTRGAECEMDGEYRSTHQKSRGNCFHDLKLQWQRISEFGNYAENLEMATIAEAIGVNRKRSVDPIP